VLVAPLHSRFVKLDTSELYFNGKLAGKSFGSVPVELIPTCSLCSLITQAGEFFPLILPRDELNGPNACGRN